LPSDLEKLKNAETYFSFHKEKLVIIDEIQRKPELFPIIRAFVDKSKQNGRFLILGSASPNLKRQSAESLAGRIIYHELSPFLLNEIEESENNFLSLLLKGGYPLSFLSEDNNKSFMWREAFISTYLERDIPQLGIRIPSLQLRRFFTMLAHYQAQLLNVSKIAASMGVSSPTINHYIDILSETFIVRYLQPYHKNLKKRLVKKPKIFIRDSGIVFCLLKVLNFEDMFSHPSLGDIFEGFVLEQVINLIPHSWEIYFYRTSAGTEIDVVLFPQGKGPIGIEVKFSSSPQTSRGFWEAFNDLQCEKGYIVYIGKEIYPIKENVYALPIYSLPQILLGNFE